MGGGRKGGGQLSDRQEEEEGGGGLVLGSSVMRSKVGLFKVRTDSWPKTYLIAHHYKIPFIKVYAFCKFL